MSWPTDLMPILLALGWVVRVPVISREEGHEAISRAAWDGLGLTLEQQQALIRGVRAPDVSLVGFLVSAFPFAQRRHALRAWWGTSTADGIRDMRAFLVATHLRAVALPDGPRRWAAFGELLHCLQDSYSPAHVERVAGGIVHMKHWGPLDALRPHDEHGFPSDRRDSAWANGTLTEEARAAVAASRGYLEIVQRHEGSNARGEAERLELAAFLDQCVRDTAGET